MREGVDQLTLSAPAYDAIRGELLAFRNANREEARDDAYFEWRYRGRPNGAEPIVVRCTDRLGATVGTLTVIPHHYSIERSTALVGLLGDISVARAWRRRGVASKMLAYLAGLEREPELAAMLVLPNAAAAATLARAGWRPVTRLRRHVALVPGVRGEVRRAPATHAPGVREVLGWLVSHRPHTRSQNDADAEIGQSAVFDERFDELWDAARAGWPILAFRDRKYLTWKYAEHPLFSYRIHTLSREGRLAGYVVYTRDGDHCLIADFLSRDGRAGLEACLRSFLGFIEDQRLAKLVVLPAPTDLFPLGSRFRLGLMRRPSFQDCLVLPVGRGPGVERLWRGERLFLTLGDKDT